MKEIFEHTIPRHVAFALVLSFGLTLFTLTESTRNSEAAEDSFRPLKEQLLKDGFSRHQVENLYRGQPSLQLKTVSRTFQLRESQLDYDQFLECPLH